MKLRSGKNIIYSTTNRIIKRYRKTKNTLPNKGSIFPKQVYSGLKKTSSYYNRKIRDSYSSPLSAISTSSILSSPENNNSPTKFIFPNMPGSITILNHNSNPDLNISSNKKYDSYDSDETVYDTSEHYLVRCNRCGNVWDGNKQCPCWWEYYNSDDSIGDTEYNEEMKNK